MLMHLRKGLVRFVWFSRVLAWEARTTAETRSKMASTTTGIGGARCLPSSREAEGSDERMITNREIIGHRIDPEAPSTMLPLGPGSMACKCFCWKGKEDGTVIAVQKPLGQMRVDRSTS